MKIFVTGGSGFVGQHLIPYLVERGHTVIAMGRSAGALDSLRKLGAQPIQGDLEQFDQSLQSALTGCDIVIHLAAAFQMWGDEDWFYRVNVTGTRKLLEMSQNADVKRFIYVSAASVIAGGIPAHQVDETYRPPHLPDDVYSKTKALAEKLVIDANSSAMQTMALRPPLIWGKGHFMLNAVRQAVARHQWVWIGGGRHKLSTIHVLNLCEAICAAMQFGRGGECYFVTDGPAHTTRTFLSYWLGAEGITSNGPNVPRFLALSMARVVETCWRWFKLHGEPPLTPAMVYMLGTELTVNDSKARAQLHYQNVVPAELGSYTGRA